MKRLAALMILPLCLAAETLVCLGDSLTAGYGVDQQEAWPTLVERSLSASFPGLRVVNAGVSGDTTAGGLRRVTWILKGKPDLVLINLGSNDGMRGIPVGEAKANLTAMVRRLKAGGARVLLAGVRLPTNLGSELTTAYAGLAAEVAASEQVPLLPFLLDGVAGVEELNLGDGIHPNAQGHRRIADTVTAFILAQR